MSNPNTSTPNTSTTYTWIPSTSVSNISTPSASSPPATVSNAPSTGQSNAPDVSPSASRRPNHVKKAFTFWDSQKFVQLYAGSTPDAERFTVHKDWACHCSPVLNAAFNSNFLEGQTQEYRLDIPSINENVVRLLVHWIYSQKVDLEQLRSNKEDEFYFANMYRALVKLYVLGDKLLIPLLQDATIEAMEEFNQKFNILPTHIIRYIYENTAPISTLRRFLVRRSASRRWATNDNLMAEQATPEFLVDVVHALHEIMTKSTRDKLRPSSDMSIFKIAKDEGTL